MSFSLGRIMSKIFGLVILTTFFSGGCSSRGQLHLSEAPQLGVLDQLHQSLYPIDSSEAVFPEIPPRDSSINTIAFELTGCYGNCPSFTVLYCQDGSAYYCGYAFVEMEGCRRGRIGPESFRDLALLFDEIEFFELPHTYLNWVTDESSVLLYAAEPDRQKVVRDYANGGPRILQAVEHLLLATFDEIRWEPNDAMEIDLVCP